MDDNWKGKSNRKKISASVRGFLMGDKKKEKEMSRHRFTFFTPPLPTSLTKAILIKQRDVLDLLPVRSRGLKKPRPIPFVPPPPPPSAASAACVAGEAQVTRQSCKKASFISTSNVGVGHGKCPRSPPPTLPHPPRRHPPAARIDSDLKSVEQRKKKCPTLFFFSCCSVLRSLANKRKVFVSFCHLSISFLKKNHRGINLKPTPKK